MCQGIVYSTEDTPSSCVLVRLGTGVSYVLIYSSLLVKLVFLISLNTGVYLPAMYQALLLFFAVLVQVRCCQSSDSKLNTDTRL